MVTRRERRAPEQRRREIIEAALALADTTGLDRLTARDVAAALGVAPGLVHHYFPTMDELVVAAFGHFATGEREDLQRLLAPLPPLPALCAHIARALETSDVAARIWMSAWVAAPRRPELAAEIDRQMLADLDLLTGVLAEGLAAGSFTLTDPRASAFRVLVLLDGILIQVSMRAEKTFGDIDELIWGTIEREVGLTPGTLSRQRG